MISKEKHKELEAEWAKVGDGVYQTRKKAHRLEFCLQHMHYFKGKHVVELGCNAGLYGYEIAQIAKSYVGVDKGDYYHDQALVTKKHIENPNVEFIRGNVKDFIKLDIAGEAPKYNALFASFALYHFSQKEVCRIAETMLPKCDVVIISTRTKKRSLWKKYNARHFEKPKNVVEYLEESGFKCETFWPESKKYALIVALKEKGNANSWSRKRNPASVGKAPRRQGSQSVEKGREAQGLSEHDAERQDTSSKGNDIVLHP